MDGTHAPVLVSLCVYRFQPPVLPRALGAPVCTATVSPRMLWAAHWVAWDWAVGDGQHAGSTRRTLKVVSVDLVLEDLV